MGVKNEREENHNSQSGDTGHGSGNGEAFVQTADI